METQINVQAIIDKFSAHNTELTKKLVLLEVQRDTLFGQVETLMAELEKVRAELDGLKEEKGAMGGRTKKKKK